ncbi:MAG: enzyme of heme biosynthesis [Alistipes sp.]|nr:enzyme of heme biosynthesis [Alistipes sp.]
MKCAKILVSAVLTVVGLSAYAQDLSDPKYAKWGETLEERKENILNSSYLKEEINNHNFDSASGYLHKLIEKCPAASENIYVNGTKLYKQRINRAQTLAEKNAYVDSLLWLYDVRLENFGTHRTRGKDYILERKAREYLTYKESDREGIRNAFEAAIAAQVEATGKADPEVLAIYFKNLCDDYSNDVVDAMTVVAAYDGNAKYFEGIAPEQEEFKEQFEKCFAMSGAASCENIEKIFAKKIADAPEDEAVIAQAMDLMSRAKCESDFFLSVGEKYYAMKPSSITAKLLAEAFQNRKEYEKANQYLREALAKETNDAERENLLVRIGILEVTTNDYRDAVEAFREAQKINPEDGLIYYFLPQCYVFGAKNCNGFAKDATFWVAYDMLQKAIPLLEGDYPEFAANAKSLAATYRSAFPTTEECFFNELSEGSTYTVNCGFVSGVPTKVRYRAQ